MLRPRRAVTSILIANDAALDSHWHGPSSVHAGCELIRSVASLGRTSPSPSVAHLQYSQVLVIRGLQPHRTWLSWRSHREPRARHSDTFVDLRSSEIRESASSCTAQNWSWRVSTQETVRATRFREHARHVISRTRERGGFSCASTCVDVPQNSS